MRIGITFMTHKKTQPPEAHILALDLKEAVKLEGEKFQEYYRWLERAMPRVFFEEVSRENLMLITHSLMGFSLQDFFSHNQQEKCGHRHLPRYA